MDKIGRCLNGVLHAVALISVLVFLGAGQAAADLKEVVKQGVLRHLGIPYANFVTGSGDGLDVELMRLFAEHLGVKYEYVRTSWSDVIGDLTGESVAARGDDVVVLGNASIKGDIVANGMTILPWRKKVVEFSTPTFPTQVWIIARADSALKPIKPTGRIEPDIASVKALLPGREVLGMLNTCLDPKLYNLETLGCKVRCFPGTLNELAPAIIKGEAELTLLDAPDSLIALDRWPGKIKIIGPISPVQNMGCAFSKKSPELLRAFNQFFDQRKRDGSYVNLVKKYYPEVFYYFPQFLRDH